MQVMIKVNGTMIKEDIKDDMLLLDFLRDHGCYSVKRGCETSNCGLCTVWMDEKPILSCGMLVARANGHEITTLEGLEKEAHEFAVFMANEGAEQCGFSIYKCFIFSYSKPFINFASISEVLMC